MKLKRKAISFVFNALYQTEDGSKVRCVYVGRENGARMMMLEGHPSQGFLKCWDFPVDAYGMASVSGLNIVGLWKEVFDLKIGQKYKTKSGLIFDVKFHEGDSFICGEGLWRYNSEGKLDPDTKNGGLNFVELVEEAKNADELSFKYQKACVENYELRKQVESYQEVQKNTLDRESSLLRRIDELVDKYESLEDLHILLQKEKRELQSVKIEMQKSFEKEALLWTNEMAELENYIRELRDQNATLENKLSLIKQLFKSV